MAIILGLFFVFLHNYCILVYSLNRLDEVILMNTHNTQFYDKIRLFPYIFFLIYLKNFVGTQKRVRISRGERAIGVRAMVRLYVLCLSVCETNIFY